MSIDEKITALCTMDLGLAVRYVPEMQRLLADLSEKLAQAREDLATLDRGLTAERAARVAAERASSPRAPATPSPPRILTCGPWFKAAGGWHRNSVERRSVGGSVETYDYAISTARRDGSWNVWPALDARAASFGNETGSTSAERLEAARRAADEAARRCGYYRLPDVEPSPRAPAAEEAPRPEYCPECGHVYDPAEGCLVVIEKPPWEREAAPRPLTEAESYAEWEESMQPDSRRTPPSAPPKGKE